MDKFALMGGSGGGSMVMYFWYYHDGAFKDANAFNQKLKLVSISIGTEEGQRA